MDPERVAEVSTGRSTDADSDTDSSQSLEELVGSLEKVVEEISPEEAQARLEVVRAIYEVTAEELPAITRENLDNAISRVQLRIEESAALRIPSGEASDSDATETGRVANAASVGPEVPIASLLGADRPLIHRSPLEKQILKLVKAVINFLSRGSRAVARVVRGVHSPAEDPSALSAIVASFFGGNGQTASDGTEERAVVKLWLVPLAAMGAALLWLILILRRKRRK